MQYSSASTERHLANLRGFDTWSNSDILSELLAGQRRALDAVEQALPALSAAADLIAPRLAACGRLIYAGAGTSIRVAVQDGSELPATFGMNSEQLIYLIAGGRAAMFDTMADAEDDEAAGHDAANICTSEDVLIAVAASGRTPFTIAAAKKAKTNGCCVIVVVNNEGSPLADVADVVVVLNSGPEVISGSTRLGAGTAQKAALNLLSSLVHTKLGAVYDGLMVNVQSGNRKLKSRAVGIVQQISRADASAAANALEITNGNIKLSVLMCSGAADMKIAQAILTASNGNLRQALQTLPH